MPERPRSLTLCFFVSPDLGGGLGCRRTCRACPGSGDAGRRARRGAVAALHRRGHGARLLERSRRRDFGGTPRSGPCGLVPMGWRCSGRGPARLCVDRRADAPAFSCGGDRCTQSHARRPDDGEWTCVETAGAEVCLGGERAAGVAAAPVDPAWLCGARRGPAAAATSPARGCASTSRPIFPTTT